MNCGAELHLRWWQHAAIFLASVLILGSRQPGAILNPQFYAEDGRVFFQDAYNLGWCRTLFHPYGGYFHALPRLASALALLVPLYLAPLVLNLIALALQALPVNLLLAARSANWGRFSIRVLMAGLYLALPNCGELNANVANAQCSLALIALLVLLMPPIKGQCLELIEGPFLLLFGLSGPYCILLLPIAVIVAYTHKGTWRWIRMAILAGTSFIEGWSLLFLDSRGRLHYILGASWERFTRILANQIYLGALLGGTQIDDMRGFPVFIVLTCVTIGGTLIVAICFYRSGIEMRSLILFAGIVFMSALVFPMIHVGPAQNLWEVMAQATGEHYWLFPILAFAWSLVWYLQADTKFLKLAAIYVLCAMTIGIVRDWEYPAFKDHRFAENARRFENAPRGAVTSFAENPEGWTLQLVKH